MFTIMILKGFSNLKSQNFRVRAFVRKPSVFSFELDYKNRMTRFKGELLRRIILISGTNLKRYPEFIAFFLRSPKKKQVRLNRCISMNYSGNPRDDFSDKLS